MTGPSGGGSRLLLPQVSTNETSATLVEWMKPDGARVRAGESVCAIETTKSVFEVEADADGYLYALLAAGEKARVGEVIAVISESPIANTEELKDWALTDERRLQPADPADVFGEDGGRGWTRKAEILARRHALDPASIPYSGKRLGEADVLAFLLEKAASLSDSATAAGASAVQEGASVAADGPQGGPPTPPRPACLVGRLSRSVMAMDAALRRISPAWPIEM